MASSEPSRELLNLPPTGEREEGDLLRDAQAGHRAAFATLVERYWERLYRWLYHLSHDRHLAEDLAQETFLKAFAHLDRFQPGTSFPAWLFRIAHNAFCNLYRARRPRDPLPEDLPDRDPGPVERVLSQEALRGLAQAVDRLPTEYRAALLLRVEEDLSFRQIADVLGLTEETARWRVFKARQKLLALLGGGPEQEKS